MYYKNPAYRISYYFIVAILMISGIACVLPMVHILMVSLSGRSATNANLVTFWPIDFTWTNYAKTLGNAAFLHRTDADRYRTFYAGNVVNGLSVIDVEIGISEEERLRVVFRFHYDF